MTKSGYAYIYTLPFWIFTEDNEQWQGHSVEYQNIIYRAYPPHRHGQSPFLNTPTMIHSNQIPGLRAADNKTFDPSVITLPTIGQPLTVQLIWSSDASKLDSKLIPKDSIRIDILPKSGELFQPVEADRFLKHLMEHVRWKTKQWWITRSSQALSRKGSFPFPINQDSIPISEEIRPFSPITCYTIFGDEKNLTEAIWKDCIASACINKEQIPVYEMLLLEARFFIASGDIRQSTLEASSAVDICKEITFQRLWCDNNPGKTYDEDRRERLLRNWDYPRHLDVKFKNHFGKSYKEEHYQEWSVINNLYEARNNIAHGGPNQYGSPVVAVDEKVCRSFVMASEHCVRWLLNT